VPTVESWEATPEPEWYDDTGGFFWNQLAGVFTNLPAFNGAILENLDSLRPVVEDEMPIAGE
jgi:hypothetical protein